MRRVFVGLLAVWTAWALGAAPAPARTLPAPPPPELPREFRGMWIATLSNIDWPSRPGLPVAQQQAELRNLLDMAVRVNLNVVILQVRPACDAFYRSSLEPWSEYLTGRMGQSPNPAWDPLQFACDEAHKRGLELHAWFNPFRARNSQTLSPASPDHISRRNSDWVVPYGVLQWLDPGIPEARKHVLDVALDLVKRYDIDGLHFDDYFYPYPFRLPDGTFQIFNDARSYNRYRQRGGRLDLVDWRRDNVNQFVEALYSAVHQSKPWVKVGISPFGIWRPNHPPGIRGLDQYGLLFADPRLWLNSGWCDYMAPQLYWPLSQTEQSFDGLLRWWRGENTLRRLMVPGLNSSKIGDDRPATDIANQIRIARRDGANGVIFYNASSLRNDRGGVATGLIRELFARPALVPPTPWLGTNGPATPTLEGTLTVQNKLLTLRWQPDTNTVTRRLVFRSRFGTQWQDSFLGPVASERQYDRRRGQAIPDEVRLVPVGPTGSLGAPAVWTKPSP